MPGGLPDEKYRYFDWGAFETLEPGVPIPVGMFLPHYFLAGPASGTQAGIPTPRPIVAEDIDTVAAVLAEPNVFSQLNSFTGVRFATREINSNYSPAATDYEILVNASANDVTISLPLALDTGQMYRIKRTDSSSHVVTVLANAGDVIDGQPSYALPTQYDNLTILDAKIGFWDRSTAVGGGTLPSDLARLNVHNIFTQLNTLTGVQLATRTVTSNYTPLPTDYTILVNATSGPVTIFLPSAVANGQVFHIKKIDTSPNDVIISPEPGDLIDDRPSLTLGARFEYCLIFDAALHYWDNFSGFIPVDIPRISLPNVFADVNTIPGIRHSTKRVNTNYTVTATDYEILADASAGPITITLPHAIATGQVFRVKKVDDSANLVTISCYTGDLIDAVPYYFLRVHFDSITLIDAAVGYWDNARPIYADLAGLSLDNTFTGVNFFSGLQLSSRTILSDDNATRNDFEILVDASSGDVSLFLPPAIGSGQFYRIKKVDTSGNLVNIIAFGTDTIDDSVSVTFGQQWADAQLFDAKDGYWDNTGGGAAGAGVSFGENGRVRDLSPVAGFAFDVLDPVSLTWKEQVRYTEPSTGPTVTAPVGYYWRPDVTTLALLKAFPTVGNDLGTKMDCLYSAGGNVNNTYGVYIIATGAAAGGDTGQVAPNDYNASTNNVYWRQVL